MPYIDGASNNYADPLVVTRRRALRLTSRSRNYRDGTLTNSCHDRQLVRLLPGS